MDWACGAANSTAPKISTMAAEVPGPGLAAGRLACSGHVALPPTQHGLSLCCFRHLLHGSAHHAWPCCARLLPRYLPAFATCLQVLKLQAAKEAAQAKAAAAGSKKKKSKK